MNKGEDTVVDVPFKVVSYKEAKELLPAGDRNGRWSEIRRRITEMLPMLTHKKHLILGADMDKKELKAFHSAISNALKRAGRNKDFRIRSNKKKKIYIIAPHIGEEEAVTEEASTSEISRRFNRSRKERSFESKD